MPAGKVIGLGNAGDGIVESDGKRYYVPGCLLNENVEFEPDETGKKICCCQDQSSMNERACLFHEDTFCVFIHCMKRKNKICPILVDREIRK